MPSDQFNNMVQAMKAQRAAGDAPSPSIPELRTGFDAMTSMMPTPADVEITEIDIDGVLTDKVVAPGAGGDRVVLYLHGGGYCIGSRVSHRHIAAKLSALTGSPVYLPEYGLGPEDPHPKAVDDALAVYRWLLAQGTDASKIGVTGESAGGGLTLALLVALRDAGDPLPAAAAPISAWCDLVELGEVTDVQLDTDFLRPEQIDLFASSYAGSLDPKLALISPVHADLSGLPPMRVYAGSSEILYNQSVRLVDNAKAAGTDATLVTGDGMFHAWPLFTGILPEADETLQDITSFFDSKLA